MGNSISTIILSAGESRRMGQPKLLLPWGGTTVLGQVVATFAATGIMDIVVVTGGAREQVEALVAELAKDYPVRTIYNPEFTGGEMLSSVRAGLRALTPPPRAALIGLGDQPQVQESVVRRICAAFVQTNAPFVIPSFQNRRGHPWLAARPVWPELLALTPVQTPRDFLNLHDEDILYLPVETDSILRDLDTPEDYARQRPH